ncbi:hypothetical protein BD410DRAFT_903240 [Rickenella mellea]|uniref:Uncharacterized protein n=1 Tax=Rickenella mellea TaxID=50990 RepID=A0A4Y7PEF2_9AGAM|nr:hypothetical protein BD410DRAFT_903240 [Rickenella mellea]
MVERPPFISFEGWMALSETVQRDVAAAFEASRNESSVPIDPRLQSERREGRIHNADTDGPNGNPYEGENRNETPAARPAAAPSTSQWTGNTTGTLHRTGPGRRRSRSMSPARTLHRSSSPARALSPIQNCNTTPLILENPLMALTASIQEVLAQNTDMRARITAIEEGAYQPVQPNRGAFSGRGASTRAKRLAQKRGGRVVPDENVEEEGGDDKEDLSMPTSELTAKGRRAKRNLQKRVCAKFRTITNVAQGDAWPDPSEIRTSTETDEQYYTPDFKKGVMYETNMLIFEKVAELVWEDLKDTEARITELKDSRIKWSRSTLVEFAKGSFQAFKTEWKAQKDAAKANVVAKNKRTNRLQQRRKDKCHRLLKHAVPLYKQKYDIDPSDLLAHEHMSDEASGPEDAEDMGEWKKRMACATFGAAGVEAMPKVQYDRLKFVEVVKPLWRSDELSAVFHDLYELWWDSLSTKEREGFRTTRVAGTGRSTDRPPLIAPFDFGIDATWWDEKHEEFSSLVCDWGTHGDPNGFGTKRRAAPAAAQTN